MKRKIRRKIKNNNIKIPVILPILVIVSILCLSIGFSAFQENMLVTDTVADIRLKKDIRVTNVSQSSASTDSYTNSLDYNKTNISGVAGLPYSDSSLTYEVEITNIENAEMGIYDLTIDNPNLDYRIETGYSKGDKLCDNNTPSKCNLGSVSTIYVTIFYKENAYDSEHIEQNFVIDFDFRGFHSITYNKITGTYQSEVMSGNTLEVNFGSNALANIKVTMGDAVLSTSDYTYTNGILNIPSVADDVIVGPKETDESCFVSTISGQINDYVCSDTDVIIPEGLALKVNGSGTPQPITVLGMNSFKNKGLTSVVIPEGIIRTLNYAFSGNNLTEVNYPQSLVNIGSYTFENNKFEEVVIPSTVTNWGSYVFRNNHISQVIFPNNMTNIPSGIFQNNCLENIDLPNSVLTIGSNAFRNNCLTEVTIPSNTTTINKNAFSENYIEELVIPNSVTSMDVAAFSENVLRSLSIGSGISTIPNNAFSNNKLTSITIPDSVTSIGRYAFIGNNLTEVRIGSRVTSLTDGQFAGGTNTRTKYDGTTINYGNNAITKVIIDNSSSNVSISSNTFRWASGYSNSNICWLVDDPTCGD